MLAGEPGIGKTSVADRAAALAAERGFTVLWGRCWEAGGAPAYWPWLDLIAELARGLDEATLLRALGDGGAAGRDRPELRARLPAMPAGAAPPSRRELPPVARGQRARAQAAANRRSSCSTICTPPISRRCRCFPRAPAAPDRVLLLGSYRDVEARMDAATGDLLARVGREGTTLSLARLDRATSARLVQERVGSVGADVEARVSIAARATLFLREMLRLWNEQGDDAIAEAWSPAASAT
jgi:hypothetical protein